MYLFVRAANGILSISALAVLTRIMSAKDYGAYALGLSASTVLSTVFFQWLSVATGRFYPAHSSNPSRLLHTANRLYWIVVAVALAIMLIALIGYGELGMTTEIIIIVALLVISQGRFNLILQLTNACGQPMKYGLVSCIRSLVAIMVSAGLVYLGAGTLGALGGALVGFGVASLFCAPVHMWSPVFGRVEPPLAAQLFRYGFPFTLTLLSIMVVDVADRFLINRFLGVEKVAPYAAAYDFTQQTIGVIINVLFLAGFPSVVCAFEGGGVDLAKKQMRELGRGILFIGPASVAGLGVLSSDVSQSLLGQTLQKEAALVIPWIAAAIMVAGVKSYYLDIPFQLFHATRLQSATAMLMAMVNLGMNVVLIPSYGILGAAWATLAAFMAGSAVSAYYASQYFDLPDLWIDIVKAVVAIAPMIITLSLIPTSGSVVWLVGKLLLGASIYLVMAWLCNLSDCRDVIAGFMTKCKEKQERMSV